MKFELPLVQLRIFRRYRTSFAPWILRSALLRDTHKQESPARRETGRGQMSDCRCDSGRSFQAGGLLDHLNDPARTRFDQDRTAVHYGVTIWRDAERLRHVVIGDADVRQHGTDNNSLRNGVSRHALANDVFAERRALIDGDTLRVANDHRAAANYTRGDHTLRLRRKRCADRA